ncbi:hypothetical protein CDL15_Pgr004422 [Punica granatum]|uniref:Acetylserotonin O-methyltransferase-like n=1 Tax=Punica granatum TaxID=22663 RepID=A0A218XHQ5_PUNGR|nr:hypothetical protein CDL15_Pgr004422 [Punica granatum]
MGRGEGSLKADDIDQLEEATAAVQAWKYALRFTEMAALKCVIELGVADEIESQGGAATLSHLSTALSCSLPSLHRIMRFLVHHRVFKARRAATQEATTYLQTALSRRLLRGGEKSMAALILFEATPTMLAPWHGLSAQVLSKGTAPQPFEAAHGQDLWAYTAQNPEHSRLLDEAMACTARLTAAAIIGGCQDVFEGVRAVVDVGGGNGTFLGMVVKALPQIQGINFDLPHVLSSAPHWDGVEHVGGNMFESIPKADATFLMQVLHDWSDSECIHILKKCREAIAEDGNGGNDHGSDVKLKKSKKVVILEAVLDDDYNGERQFEEEEDSELQSWSGIRLSLDMVMMAHTNGGKERSRSEWAHLLAEAGFSSFSFKPTSVIPSVIEAFP